MLLGMNKMNVKVHHARKTTLTLLFPLSPRGEIFPSLTDKFTGQWAIMDRLTVESFG